MAVLLHPTYFPSIVQMAVIVQCEEVIFEREDNYQKQTYRNRAHIAHTNGILTLNIPIRHAKNGERQKTKNVTPENNFPWQSQHWKSLQTAYRTSPFFEFYEDELHPLFSSSVNSLMEHNMTIFDLVCELMGITPSYTFSGRYEAEPSVTDLRFLVNAKKEPDYGLKHYTQVLADHHGFLSNLSILDLLFNEGPGALDYLENQSLDFLP